MTGEWAFENLTTPVLIVGVMYLCLPGILFGAPRLRKFSAERLMKLRRPAATLDRYCRRFDNRPISVWARRAVPGIISVVFVFRHPLHGLSAGSYVLLGVFLFFLYFWLFVHLRGGLRLRRLSALSGHVLRKMRRERGWWDVPSVLEKPIPRSLQACYWYGPVYALVGCCAVALAGDSGLWAAVVIVAFTIPMFVERPAKLYHWIQESTDLAVRLIDESVAMGRTIKRRGVTSEVKET